nr:reverse transcriptase domain-containing protein [Tanacetum cinerariifolium]
LEEHLAAMLGLNESQPCAAQSIVRIHHSSDKIIVGAFALSLALDVLDARARRIRENIMSHRSLFQDVSSSELKKLSNYENLTERLEEFQDAQSKVVNDKFDKLYADFVEATLHLEERFYPHLLTTIDGRRWLLNHGTELAIVKCLNSPEYLSALWIAVSKAIEKGMQDGLAVGITHGREGRVLIDVAAHNPVAEANYVSALQKLQSVNFSLLAELKTNKDASIEAVMNILRLEEHLAAMLGLNESQPCAAQSIVRICLIENALKLPEDPSVNQIHGSGSSPSFCIGVSKESSSGLSTMKSTNICRLTDTLDLAGNNEALEVNLDLLEESRVEDTGKLGLKWEGPYEVMETLGKGAYKLRDRDGKQLPRTWNISNLKKSHIHKM